MVTVNIGEQAVELDFERQRWSASNALVEGEFPLIAVVLGKRYELYSDGTFDEEERNARH